MATLRTVINRVLGAIGDPQISGATTTITDSYQLQLLEFINQIKEEIEGSVPWRALWVTATASITSSNNSGTLTGTNERSQLVRLQDSLNGQFVPLLFNVTVATVPLNTIEHELARLRYQQLLDPVSTNSQLVDFAVDQSTAGTLTLQVYPKASATQSFSGTFYVPQTSLTATDLDTNIKIPERVLVQGSVWFALEERGEELGQSGMWTEERYRKALDDAVSLEISEQGGLQLVPT
jgi:hypothetical protein